jgi:putative phosphoesterase
MAIELALVADTHVPSRAERIPEWVERHLQSADHVVHAGDFDSPEAYDRVVELAGGPQHLTAVAGNLDPASLDLSAVETFGVDGVTFVVTHGSGPREGYHGRVASVVRERGGDDAVGVSGHTHEVMDERYDGVRLLNPGSATGASPASATSLYTAVVDDGDLEVTLHRELR